MSVNLAPIINTQFFTNQGVILAGGLIYTYAAGTTTPLATYTDPSQSVPNANPIVLNSAGFPPQEVWLLSGQQYKFVVKDSSGNTLNTYDNVSGINDVSAAVSEWVTLGVTPTYVNGTTFTVPGNQTGTLMAIRRVKASISAGTIYGTILTSVFSSVTTITVAWDSGQLDSGLSSVSYSLISGNNTSTPNALVNIQTFPSHGTFTYTPDPGATCVEVFVIGAGGGSAGVPSTGGAQVSAAGGGGGGAVARSFLRSAQGLSGTTVTVGQGGTAGAAGLNNGGNGGQSAFGSITAAGGFGAAATAAGSAPLIAGGGSPGVAAGGNLINTQGASGGYGLVVANGAGVGGAGGANGLGYPGVPGNTSGQPGIAGANPGTGASGGCQGNSGSALAGAAGADGIVIVYEYV